MYSGKQQSNTIITDGNRKKKQQCLKKKKEINNNNNSSNNHYQSQTTPRQDESVPSTLMKETINSQKDASDITVEAPNLDFGHSKTF